MVELMLLSKRSKDLSNQVFGSLTAIRPTHKKNGMIYWLFQCKCGKSHNARGNTITYQSKKGVEGVPSCGCVELTNKTKHGLRKVSKTHPIYRAYQGMKNRCYNPNTAGFKWYGAKGITVCDEWLKDFNVFYKWSLENGWCKGLHIDKDIKSPGNTVYSPNTCMWVSPSRNVAAATNRDNYGKHPNVKLSYEDVAEIERLYFSGEETNQSALARRYGLLSPSSIGRLIREAKKIKGLE